MVIAIIALLAALLGPALISAREKGRKAACVSNLRQVGIAIQTYAADNDGNIPFGPVAPPFTSPFDFYPSTGAPTSLISLGHGAPVGLGLLLSHQLSRQSRVLFCPGPDQPQDAAGQLAKVGVRQAQCSFYYRHGGNTKLFDVPGTPVMSEHIRLESLGRNRNDQPIRALALDTQFLCTPGLAPFGITPFTHHRQRFVNVLFADGHVQSRPNGDARFTVDLGKDFNLATSFDAILKIFERADLEF